MHINSTIKYRPEIDGLRAIAVLGVMVFHAFPEFMPGGFIGVDVFFVISGYLITSIIMKNIKEENFSFLDFYFKRAKRIFPSLVIILIFCLSLGSIALLPDEFSSLGKHVAGGGIFSSNFILWSEAGYFDKSSDLKPLLHLWSLGIEEQFYIAWPLILLGSTKAKLSLKWIAVGLATVSLIYCLWIVNTDPTAAFYSPLARAWELLAGVVLAIFGNVNSIPENHSKFKNAMYSKAIPWSALISVIMMFLFFNSSHTFPGLWSLVPVLGTCALIRYSPQTLILKRVLSNRLVVWVGLISYPLYLWHWPILSFARIINSGTPPASFRLGLLAITFFLSYLTYQLIEKQIKKIQFRTMATCISYIILVLVSLIGFYSFRSEGFKDRPSAQKYAAFELELIRGPNEDERCKKYVGHPFNSDYCRFHDLGSNKTFAIIGDSHAHVLFAGFTAYAEKNGMNLLVLGNGACPPYLGVTYGLNEASRKACGERIDELLNFVGGRKDIVEVLMVTRGTFYITGHGYGPVDDPGVNTPISSRRPELNAQNPKDLFRNAVQETSIFLKSHNKKPVFLLENPELGIDSRDCIPRPLFDGSKSEKCKIMRETVLARQQVYRDAIYTIQGLKMIDSLAALCPEKICPLFMENRLIYADDDHLSLSGSYFLARSIFDARNL